MRLTLRTLLAYLDDILEPADARDLGQKIEESEFASGLVHRIRSVTRKLRLGAPKLSGKGMGLDANTVAEYLDNTLPQDRVPDFEKVCLESDVHLAEVASCHQILTLVLGEPADVDPALRERIRSLPEHLEAQGLEAEEGKERDAAVREVAAPPVESPPIDRRDQEDDWEESPDMPKVTPGASRAAAPSSSIRLMPVVATLVVAFLLALAGLVAMGPLDSDHPILGGILPKAASEGTSTKGTEIAQATGKKTPDTAAEKDPLSESSDGAGPGTMRQEEDGTTRAGAVTDPIEDGAEDNAFPPVPGTTPVPGIGKVGAEPAGAAAGDTATADTAAGDTATGDTAAAETVDTGSADMVAPDPSGATTEAAADGGAVTEPAPLAHCASNLHILARLDPASGNWLRMSTNDPIAPQQELVALPTYRPQITFSSGIQVMLIGPAAVSLREPGADGVPGLIVHYGRIVATTDGAPTAAFDLQMGERTSRVTLPNLDASLVLDVYRYHAPGTNPEEHPAHWLIQAMAAGGPLTWHSPGADAALSLEAGDMAAMIDDQPPRVTNGTALPDWLDAKNVRLIDRDASQQLEPLLSVERPLATALLEQASNRLVEVRSLAMRSLCTLGSYDSFIVTAFNSKTYRTFWPDLMLALRIALGNDSESATQIRTTLERLRGPDGALLYRFLRGYSPTQLEEEGAAALVEGLSSESMDIRVFAYENLFLIAEKTNSYQPDLPPDRQRRAILNWQRDLKQNSITYKTPPLEVSE